MRAGLSARLGRENPLKGVGRPTWTGRHARPDGYVPAAIAPWPDPAGSPCACPAQRGRSCQIAGMKNKMGFTGRVCPFALIGLSGRDSPQGRVMKACLRCGRTGCGMSQALGIEWQADIHATGFGPERWNPTARHVCGLRVFLDRSTLELRPAKRRFVLACRFMKPGRPAMSNRRTALGIFYLKDRRAAATDVSRERLSRSATAGAAVGVLPCLL